MTGTDPNTNAPEGPWIDPLDEQLVAAFPGRVVRKDLVHALKVGFNIPVYVLEYLLGKYCSTTDEAQIREGLDMVKQTIAERVVRADQAELIKSRLQRSRSMKLIDLVTVTFDEKDQGGKYWAALATAGLTKMHISEDLVHKYERVLTGGVWSNVEITYDDTLVHGTVTRPFVLSRMQPIQIASARLDEFLTARASFTREQWVDVLLRTMGYEPTHPDFTWRRKLLYLLRLVPMVEKNYNLIELGPRETGKSFVFRELSPYAILLSGGQGTVADLFGWKHRKDKAGLVVRYDLVAFDEVAGSYFKNESEKQMFKGYMEQGSFSRGDDKGTISADAGIIFNGNIDGNVEAIARTTHLFTALPESVRNDTAFHDRWHAYLPGWEMPKLRPEHFTRHLGFIADYIAEIFHNELRRLNFTDLADQHFALGNHVGQRDRKAALRTVSGLIKLLHPDGKCSKDELGEYLDFGLELRRRVKEQLKRINPIEFSRVNLSFIDKQTGEERFAECAELGAIRLIPEGPLPPGDVFSVGVDPGTDRVALFRIQAASVLGTGRFNLVGVTSKNIRESAKMAFDYLRANGKRVGLVLGRRRLGALLKRRPLATISGAGIHQETQLRDSDAGSFGLAMSKAVLDAAAGLDLPAHAADAVYCDINGERYRSEEWGLFATRAHAALRSLQYQTFCGSIGDVGAAFGAIASIAAAQSFARGYARGPRALVMAGSDSGTRGAMFLHDPRLEGRP